jgi:hypothetical protein
MRPLLNVSWFLNVVCNILFSMMKINSKQFATYFFQITLVVIVQQRIQKKNQLVQIQVLLRQEES